MTHLLPEELIDLADASQSAAAVPHLAECHECRATLADLRATMTAMGTDVPEPSPLFWEHLSTRVRNAVESDGQRQRDSWASRWFGWRVLPPAAASVVAILLLTVGLRTLLQAPATTLGTSGTGHALSAGARSMAQTDTTIGEPVADPATANADESTWALMGDLATGLDWDAAFEAGLATPAGSVDRAVYDLTPAERIELQRLLQHEIEQSTATRQVS